MVERVNALTSVTDWIDVYGLLRRDALLATHGFQAQFGGDVILTMELCLNGDVMHIPEQLWSVRIFTNKTASEQAQTIIPFQAKKCLAVSYSDLSASFLRTISYAKLPFRQRFPALIRCLYNCSVSNPTLRYLIARDRSRPVHRAWKEKRYGDVLSLAILAMFVFFARALNRLRAPRINLER